MTFRSPGLEPESLALCVWAMAVSPVQIVVEDIPPLFVSVGVPRRVVKKATTVEDFAEFTAVE